MPGSQKIHFIPNWSKAAPIKKMNAIVPIPWKDHTAPMATPRYLLNQSVTLDTSSTVNMVEANPSKTPK